MDGRIRVKTDKKHAGLYDELTNFAVGDSHELFFLCACLGYSSGQAEPLGKSGKDRFWSSTIAADEWYSYYAMILEENEMDFRKVQEDSEVLARMEEYANSGMRILIEECLGDFLAGSEDMPSLEASVSSELPKTLLHYVCEQDIAGQEK